MGQRGFWDEVRRMEKIDEMQPSLPRMKELIPWESFRPLLLQAYPRSEEQCGTQAY
jgi:IS5 family transposase